MTLNLTMLEAAMLLDAVNRMECDDIWDGDEHGYGEKEGNALQSARNKIGQAICYAESKKAKAAECRQEEKP